MEPDFSSAWSRLVQWALEDDARRRDRRPSDVPAIMAALVVAAQQTELRRFYPFTSHNLLRFSPSDNLSRDRNNLVSVFIVVAPAPARYLVCSGSANAEPWAVELETASPIDAASAAERLLGT